MADEARGVLVWGDERDPDPVPVPVPAPDPDPDMGVVAVSNSMHKEVIEIG